MDERIIKYYQGNLTQAEQTELLKDAFANPDLKKLLIEQQHLQSLIGLSKEAIDTRQGAAEYTRFAKHILRQKQKHILLAVMRYAAIVVLLVGSTWWAATRHQTIDPVAIARQELYVPSGQRARLTLPDGSKVWLNAGSTLSYPSVFGAERRVHLSGEGFFEVAKNEAAPFIVSTQTIDIKALGTAFNVFSYPKSDYMSVYLKEGSVKAYYAQAEAKGVTLSPNQQLIGQNGQLNIKNVPADPLLWRDGIYTFNKQKLGDIVKLLELYYDVSIAVKDPDILDYEYTGKFRQRDGVMEILRVIQRIHKFKIIQNEELNQILLMKR